jgi:hypothetical protein
VCGWLQDDTIHPRHCRIWTGEKERGPAIALGKVPLWLFPKSSVDVDMIEGRKEWGKDLRKCVVRYRLSYLFLRIYTDGSNDPVSGRVGAGVYIPDLNVRVCKRLTDFVRVCG